MSAATALTAAEQNHVRAAMRFLRVRVGAETFAKALKADLAHLRRVVDGRCPVSESVAVRVAKLAGVGVDDVLGGKYPAANVCPHCWNVRAEAPE